MKGKITLMLFFTTVLVFLYQMKTGDLRGVTSTDLHYENFITYAFFHSSSTHLSFNLIALLSFGYYLEERIGAKKFLILFFVTTIFAGVVYVLIYPSSSTPCVGLSGFVFGILGASLVIYKGEYKNYFLLIALGYVIFTVFLIYVDLVGEIAHAVHLGGLLMGSVLEICYEKRREGYFLMGSTLLATTYLVVT